MSYQDHLLADSSLTALTGSGIAQSDEWPSARGRPRFELLKLSGARRKRRADVPG